MKGKEREFNIRSFAPTCQVSVRIGVVRFARVVVTLVALEGDQAFVSLAGALRWTATRTVSRYAAVRPKQCVIGDRVVLATSRPLRRSRVGPGGCHRGSTRKEQQAVRYELHGGHLVSGTIMARLHGFRENARTQVFSRKTTRFPGANETELLRKEGTAALCAWRGRKSTSHAHLIPHTCPGAAFH